MVSGKGAARNQVDEAIVEYTVPGTEYRVRGMIERIPRFEPRERRLWLARGASPWIGEHNQ